MWIIGSIFIIAGLIFNTLAVIGMLRFPDVYTRAHALGIADTLGVFLILIGTTFFIGPLLLSIKVFLLLILLFLINPTIIHTVLQAAVDADIKPWQKDS